MASNKYAIRRALLKAAVRFSCPQELNTLLCDDGLILLQSDPARIKAEWDELTAAGMLLVVEGYPGFRSVSPAVRRRLENGETMLDDPFLSGQPR